jgi:hypothetical protein
VLRLNCISCDRRIRPLDGPYYPPQVNVLMRELVSFGDSLGNDDEWIAR